MSLENELKNLTDALIALTEIQKAFLQGAVITNGAETQPGDKKKTTPKTETKPAAKKKTTKPKTEKEEAPKPDAKKETAAPTRDQVRQNLIKVMKKCGQPRSMELLATVGNAPSVSELKEENFQTLIDACQELING